MANEISKITLPNGATYDIKDAAARTDIEDLKGSITGGMHYIGVSTTALADGSTANPIVISGQSITAKSGDIAIYGEMEFVFSSTDNKWHEFGSTGSLKGLAFKDSVSGTVTPTGTISTPTITVTPETGTVNSITGVGTLPSCTLPNLSTSVSNETLSLSWTAGSFNAGTLPTKTDNVTVATGIKSASSSQPIFTGSEATIVSE